MTRNDLRIFDVGDSLLLLFLTLVIVSFLLLKILKAKHRKYIPLLLSLYGCIFCWCIIYVFGKGFTGIPFVLISWLFLLLLAVSILAIGIKSYLKNAEN